MTQGYYLYCIAETNESVQLGQSGIDHSLIVTIPFQSLVVFAHQVDSLDFFEDNQKAKQWAMAHQSVIDEALKKYNTVLPFTLGNIIRGGENELKKWMEKEYNRLIRNIEKVRGKAEYGVQIFWTPAEYIDQIYEINKELKELKEETDGKKAGTAYLYHQRLEKALQRELEHQAILLFQKFYEKIKESVTEIIVEKIKNIDSDQQMILNVSCLASKDQEAKLGDFLDELEEQGYFIQFTGPWPAYSFVN